MISNQTRILVTLEDTDFGYCILHTNSFEHGKSRSFYINRQSFRTWLNQAPWLSMPFLENDGCSFLKVNGQNDGRLRFTLFWLLPLGDTEVVGNRQIFTLPFMDVFDAIDQRVPTSLAAAIDPVHYKAQITLTQSAQRQIRHLSDKKLKKRAFVKAMRDSFQWKDSSIELYGDFNNDFGFREKRGSDIGIVGGLCLSQSAVLGKDGLKHPCYSYGVHT